MRVAINGFGRIGRLVLRALIERNHPELQLIQINDIHPVDPLLFQYDSIHGRFNGDVSMDQNTLTINNHSIQTTLNETPKWDNIDLVLECSGHYTSREKSQIHLDNGAKRVLISAPADNVDLTVIKGVNDHLLNNQLIVSNGSCTTNCLAPVVKIMHELLGIEKGFMTTIHSYTGDQRLVDTSHKDPRRARAAAVSMIPSSTGAAKAMALVFPELKGKIDGTSMRVPTPNVSVIDFKFLSSKKTTVNEINEAFKQAASTQHWNNVLNYVDDPLVSCDFNHTHHSSHFDATQTQVTDHNFCRVVSWYDNEWGFSNRMVDIALFMSTQQ